MGWYNHNCHITFHKRRPLPTICYDYLRKRFHNLQSSVYTRSPFSSCDFLIPNAPTDKGVTLLLLDFCKTSMLLTPPHTAGSFLLSPGTHRSLAVAVRCDYSWLLLALLFLPLSIANILSR